jgi:hypothetical protein
MNGILRACCHAQRLSALLASDRKMKIVGIAATAQDLNAGPGASLFSCMLQGTGFFALPATSALERVDRKQAVSDHFDDLLLFVALVVKVWRGTPELFLLPACSVANERGIYPEFVVRYCEQLLR